MYYNVFSAECKLLYGGDSWPMARSALDQVILEAEKLDPFPKFCPNLMIYPYRGYGQEKFYDDAGDDEDDE